MENSDISIDEVKKETLTTNFPSVKHSLSKDDKVHGRSNNLHVHNCTFNFHFVMEVDYCFSTKPCLYI